MKRDVKTRFEKFIYYGLDGCWYFTGHVNRWGYGRFQIDGCSIPASRVSYSLYKDRNFDESLLVCHTCDNRACVNPDHLFLGTQIDNMRDMVQKKRNPLGERKLAAKLTDKDVIEIRKSKLKQYELAAKYGVSKTAIRYVIIKQTWKHV